jgi:hypothetical protein
MVDASMVGAQGGGQYQTIVNGKPLTAEQKAEFRRIYGVPPLAGDFWYDTRSGLWGVGGREAFGILRPGHAYGPLAATASATRARAAISSSRPGPRKRVARGRTTTTTAWGRRSPRAPAARQGPRAPGAAASISSSAVTSSQELRGAC